MTHDPHSSRLGPKSSSDFTASRSQYTILGRGTDWDLSRALTRPLHKFLLFLRGLIRLLQDVLQRHAVTYRAVQWLISYLV
jgi:hypothetical protein